MRRGQNVRYYVKIETEKNHKNGEEVFAVLKAMTINTIVTYNRQFQPTALITEDGLF